MRLVGLISALAASPPSRLPRGQRSGWGRSCRLPCGGPPCGQARPGSHSGRQSRQPSGRGSLQLPRVPRASAVSAGAAGSSGAAAGAGSATADASSSARIGGLGLRLDLRLQVQPCSYSSPCSRFSGHKRQRQGQRHPQPDRPVFFSKRHGQTSFRVKFICFAVSIPQLISNYKCCFLQLRCENVDGFHTMYNLPNVDARGMMVHEFLVKRVIA